MIDPRKSSPALRKAQAAYIAAIIDEILPPIRLAARNEGYAIAVHGTLARDIDLVAIPWVEHARPPELLIKSIRGILSGVFGACYVSAEPIEKPQGRKAWTFRSHTMEAEIDLSVMPLVAQQANDE